MSSKILTTFITVGTLAVLGRLISVEDFGLFAIVLIFKNLLSPIVDFALAPAYIKLEQTSEEAVSSFYTVNLYISILAGLSMVVFSILGVHFFDNPELRILVLMYSLAVFFSSISGQPIAILKRNKRYDQLAKIDFTMSLSGAVLVCLLAFLGFGVWALIWRGIFEALVRTGMLVKASAMQLRIASLSEISKYKSSIKFASQIVISRIPNRIILTIDKVIIGKFFGTEALGFYSRASQPAQMVDTNLGKPISSPALSYLARIEGRVEARHYLSLLWSTYLVAGFGCLILILFGDELLPLLMGENWVQAGILLQYLGIWGVGKIFHSLSASYHINERKITRWTQYMIIGIAAIYLVPLTSVVFDYSLEFFTLSFAVSYCAYWVFVYFYSMYIDCRQSLRLLIEAALKLAAVSLLTIYVQIFIETFLTEGQQEASDELLLLGLKILMTGIIFAFFFLILASKERQALYKILFKK